MSGTRSCTSTDQYTVYLNFLEDNPEFRENKQIVSDPNYLNDQWNALTFLLNNCATGVNRDVKKWKKVLRSWRFEVKKKARKIHLHTTGTGGGKPCQLKLTNIEERLLHIMCKTVITADPALPFTAGFYMEHETENPQTAASTSAEVEPKSEIFQEVYAYIESEDETPIECEMVEPTNDHIVLPTESRKTSRKTRSGTNCLTDIADSYRDRSLTVGNQFDQVASALASMAKSMEAIVKIEEKRLTLQMEQSERKKQLIEAKIELIKEKIKKL